jgi:Flp pilus assembly protein TadB
VDKRPKIQLDYSSLTEEMKRKEHLERERREKLEDYNECTFGARRPVERDILWLAGGMVAGVLLAFLHLSRGMFVTIETALGLGFFVWYAVRRL